MCKRPQLPVNLWNHAMMVHQFEHPFPIDRTRKNPPYTVSFVATGRRSTACDQQLEFDVAGADRLQVPAFAYEWPYFDSCRHTRQSLSARMSAKEQWRRWLLWFQPAATRCR